jgi:hypothetical protein
MDAPQNLDAHEVTPLWDHFNIWKGDNICHHIWDKDELLYDGCWEHKKMLKSFLEPIGNLMGTRKEEDAICQCGRDNR